MAGGRTWVNYALATVRSQWHFHMDLLDLWKDELSKVSMSLFVMDVPTDLAVYQRVLNYYELVLRLFCLDTGYDCLVSLYDGEIRSNSILYQFFSESPLYLQSSAAYYNAKLEDINEQFTDQFVGNLALIWGLIVPDAMVHFLASSPQAIFETKANKLLTDRYSVLDGTTDFFKVLNHTYSYALKNFTPFITSPEIWRVYNPIIDTYFWTICAHVLCLKAFKDSFRSRLIKPFIETQRTIISANGNAVAEARLTGDGIITADIDTANLTPGVNQICFNTYNLISCVTEVDLYTKFHLGGRYMENIVVAPEATHCTLADPSLSYTVDGIYTAGNSSLVAGFNFWNPGKLKTRIGFDFFYTPHYAFRPTVGCDLKYRPNYTVLFNYTNEAAPGRYTLEIPELEFFRIRGSMLARYTGGDGPPFTVGNISVEILPDDYPIPGFEYYLQQGIIDLCPLGPWQ